MEDSSYYFTNSDLYPDSENDDFASSASTASVASDERVNSRGQWQATAVMTHNQPSTLWPGPLMDPSVPHYDVLVPEKKVTNDAARGANSSNRPLRLLDLPVDLLQVIIKEVTHTTDLTSLALTCSTLHSLAIPQMYSRFDIVWPDTASTSEHPAGVDALSYGLATLVMGEDIFHELPPDHRPTNASSRFTSNGQQVNTPTQHGNYGIQRIRRGNYYAQYTRKFSVGNGPSLWVSEYYITKETGKMLGTLVALAVARMVNLETFIWDMPTGVVRDVWIALSSLANRPGHECRLKRVWVRWHDNSVDNPIRPAPSAATASSSALPATQNPSISPNPGPQLMQKYRHVEYPTLSVLPPLEGLTVLNIDEPSYLEETAVLIERSRERLRELRIGIHLKVYHKDWLKPLQNWSSDPQDAPSSSIAGWPKNGGVLGVLFGVSDDHARKEEKADQSPVKKQDSASSTADIWGGTAPQPVVPAPSSAATHVVPQTTDLVEMDDHNNDLIDVYDVEDVAASQSLGPPFATQRIATSMNGPKPHSHNESKAGSDPGRQLLNLEILELERVALHFPVTLQALDWTRLTTLTILGCDGHERLWRGLRRQFTPSTFKLDKKTGGGDYSSEYFLRIKHICTDMVSPYLLLFIKDTLAPNSLETLFLREAPDYDSIVHINAIYKTVIRNHRQSLRKLLIDSTEKSPGGIELSNNRWRKWMFRRDMISFITSGRMPRLRELSMTVHSKDWHFFLQRLPNIPRLQALHIPHVVHPVHRDEKELALQILDIVTIRPEVGISYIGMQKKCYEILEGKRGEHDDSSEDTGSDAFVPAVDWEASDANDDDTDDEDGAESAAEAHSEVSYGGNSDSESDDSDVYEGKSRVTFRLREILFYDDKIAIFKARHGVL